MPKPIVVTLLALALAAGTPSTVAHSAEAEFPPAATVSDETGKIAGRYIVTLKETGTDRQEDVDNAVTTATEHASDMGAFVHQVYRHALHGYAASMTASTAATLARDPQVQSVQQDRLVRATAHSVPTGVDRVNADLSPTAAINGVDTRVDADVAVIDTGVSTSHPDLNVNRSGGVNCWMPFLPPNDLNGHGTHVAGTIGALDNGTGVVGVAPGVRLWPVQVLNPLGMGFTSTVLCGIDYVTQHADQIDVANMSLGGAGTDDGNCGKTDGDPMHQAICNSVAKGVTYVVAAGNSHADAKNTVPAAYDEVITVSALADFDGKPGGLAGPTCRADQDDTFADFSNFGSDVDLIAPGVCIRSTYLNGGYATMSGTSMAAPHVAGGAALYQATHPTASPQTVKAALQNTGSLDWSWPSQDGDAVKERLLSVSTF
ncbi:S8 family peptidase [Streptomyces sp. TRM49041]|uniref:S8 family peptidase n=1 Tax=Streptomyces sp. TRM49041 TaxID=2603216 RepID=UPI0011EF8019|nr:S8 family peptidase [Streptomyces sp. TRM49041]